MQRIVENNVFLNYVLALKRHQNYHARKVPRNFAIKKKKKKIEQSLQSTSNNSGQHFILRG